MWLHLFLNSLRSAYHWPPTIMLGPSFPLPRGYFSDVRISATYRRHLVETAHVDVALTLMAEREFAAQGRRVQSNKWKLARQKRELCIYRRRTRSLEPGSERPTMFGCGRLEGSLEDVIYGSFSRTHEEFSLQTGFMDLSVRDCAVLQTLETATSDDTLHYLGLKWMATSLPLAKPRDWCYLESVGISRDDEGDLYGYIVMRSVNLYDCPAFQPKVAVRGQLFFTYIFRESSKGMVDVYARGLFDPEGDVSKSCSVLLTSDAFFGLFKAVTCAEAKRLTRLAMSIPRSSAQPKVRARCSMCTAGHGIFTPLRCCRVCRSTVCHKCCVKKNVFVGLDFTLRKIQCCTNCIIKAKELGLRSEHQDEESEAYQLQEFSSTSYENADEFTGDHSPTADHTMSMYSQSRLSLEDIEETSTLPSHDDTLHFDVYEPSPSSRERSWGSIVVPPMFVGSPLLDFPSSRRRLTPQQVLFIKMLALQHASIHAYEMTRANHELMKNSCWSL